ncbi:MAG: cysteine hydrolase [Oscillospiraceae bacterium]|nr:cysteine hydrolase [Oscillospiraceae bacterium]
MAENTRKRSVLIVIDMQNDFIDGALGTSEAREILPSVVEKVRKGKENGDAVLFTRDTHGENYLDTLEGRLLPVTHCVKGTRGWQICSPLEPYTEGGSAVIDKPTFGWTGWEQTFRERGIIPARIEIAGLCTDICVVSNALILRALYPEADMAVDASCCAGVTPEKHKAALLTMASCQIEIL